MPKMYPLEVRLFAIQKREQGHSWNRVAELIREEFKIQPPARRQMGKWMKDLSARDELKQALSEEATKKADAAKVEALAQVTNGLLPRLWMAKDAGEDIEYSGWKWFFSIQESVLGSVKFRRFIKQYLEEQKGSSELPTASIHDMGGKGL